MDNRLRVERDELRHAAAEAEKRSGEQRAVFEGKLQRLRRRARGVPDGEDEGRAGRPASVAAAIAGAAPSTSLPAPETATPLKHVNLFEEAEQEDAKHRAEHEKRLSYQRRNNELAGVSKSLPLSEFDKILADTPWYMRPPSRALAADVERETSDDDHIGGGASSLKGAQRQTSMEGLGHGEREEGTAPSRKQRHTAIKVKKAKKSDRDRKTKRKRRGKSSSSSGSTGGKRALAGLRRERQQREMQERARAAALLGSHVSEGALCSKLPPWALP